MDQYRVTNENEEYLVEADSKNKARKEVLKKEGITVEKVEFEDVGDTTGEWIFLEQDDPRWADEKIGKTSFTIGAYGCLITDLSMLSYWYGGFFTPEEIAKKANFTNEGYYIWSSGDLFLPFDFEYRYYNRDIEKIKSILFSDDNAVVVRVSAYGAYHWLAVIGYDQVSKELLGADPLTGDRVFIESKYGKINGFAEVKRNK